MTEALALELRELYAALADAADSWLAKREPTGGGIPAGPEIQTEATDVRDPQLQPT